MYLLQCSELIKNFDNAEVIRSVSFDIAEGEFVAFVGPSGAGKSSLLRLLAGLDELDSGSILMNDEVLSGDAVHVRPERRGIGMVFQHSALFPHLNVGKNVGYGLDVASDLSVPGLLEMVGLEGFEERNVVDLSGGEMQRVSLARSLAANPKLLLLDEPFAHLDARIRITLRRELYAMLKERGVTVILVTHDQDEALSFADRVGVLMDGELLCLDAPQSVYLNPPEKKVASFLGDANFLKAQVVDNKANTVIGPVQVVNGCDCEGEVMVRPENVVLTPDEKGEGIITSIEYFGHDSLVEVEVSGERIISRMLVSDPRIAVGKKVAVSVRSFGVVYQ